MTVVESDIRYLVDKEAIRDLVIQYSRAIDRKDIVLLRDLYTDDAVDIHGDVFSGGIDAYCEFIGRAFERMAYSGHYIANHLISIEGDVGHGEVYSLSYQLIRRADGGQEYNENFIRGRLIDDYRRCDDGKWRFSKRVVIFDVKVHRPFSGEFPQPESVDPSYIESGARLFERGKRK